MFSIILPISAIYHMIGITNLMEYLYSLKKVGEVIVYGNKKESQEIDSSKEFIFITNCMVGFPVLVDLFIVGYYSESMLSRIYVYSISAWIAIVLKNQPFYEFNHIVFHLSLIVQTVFLCFCNRR